MRIMGLLLAAVDGDMTDAYVDNEVDFNDDKVYADVPMTHTYGNVMDNR